MTNKNEVLIVLTNINDLIKLKVVYKNIIDDMKRNKISIWDEIYSCEFFSDDTKNNCLYLLAEENGDIVAAFARDWTKTNVGTR